VPLLQQFIDKITRLKRANTKYGMAPHKPVLLLAFIDLFDNGLLTENHIYVDADLVGAFLENWRLLVGKKIVIASAARQSRTIHYR